jgi:hypothetical protein
MATDLQKCIKLLDLLKVEYTVFDYDGRAENKEIRIDDDSEKLTLNGYCSASIDFDKDGNLKMIDIWGD